MRDETESLWMLSDGAMLNLLRLVSPGLPVGAFSYSRGLETAIARGLVHDEASAQDWILGTLEHFYAPLDGALFWRMMAALSAEDRAGFLRHDAWLRASRESGELQLEDLRMGKALMRLLSDLDVALVKNYAGRDLSYPAAFALAARHWNIPEKPALRGLMWSVLESQVGAAMRLVPLGQTTGQRIMIEGISAIERCAAQAECIADDEIGNAAIGMAMASAWHEVQYTRLFRS